MVDVQNLARQHTDCTTSTCSMSSTVLISLLNQKLYVFMITNLKELTKVVVVKQVFLIRSKVLLYKCAIKVKWHSLTQCGGAQDTAKVF